MLQILILTHPVLVVSSFAYKLYVMWNTFITLFVSANVTLAVFNMIPIPPLDGSRLVSVILPAKIAYVIEKYVSPRLCSDCMTLQKRHR